MAWTEFTRKRYERNTARYSSDVTDEEWAIVAPLLLGPNPLGEGLSACVDSEVLLLRLA